MGCVAAAAHGKTGRHSPTRPPPRCTLCRPLKTRFGPHDSARLGPGTSGPGGGDPRVSPPVAWPGNDDGAPRWAGQQVECPWRRTRLVPGPSAPRGARRRGQFGGRGDRVACGLEPSRGGDSRPNGRSRGHRCRSPTPDVGSRARSRSSTTSSRIANCVTITSWPCRVTNGSIRKARATGFAVVDPLP